MDLLLNFFSPTDEDTSSDVHGPPADLVMEGGAELDDNMLEDQTIAIISPQVPTQEVPTQVDEEVPTQVDDEAPTQVDVDPLDAIINELDDLRIGEIVGLNYATNGRSCVNHICCGNECVAVGTVVKLYLTVVTIDGINEEAIKAVIIGNNLLEYCTVGFLSRNIVIGFRDRYLNKTCEIIEKYQYSESRHKRELNHLYGGVAAFKFIDDIATIHNE